MSPFFVWDSGSQPVRVWQPECSIETEVIEMWRTVDTRTLKGLLEAERLHRNGWKIVSVGLYILLFFKPKGK